MNLFQFGCQFCCRKKKKNKREKWNKMEQNESKIKSKVKNEKNIYKSIELNIPKASVLAYEFLKII